MGDPRPRQAREGAGGLARTLTLTRYTEPEAELHNETASSNADGRKAKAKAEGKAAKAKAKGKTAKSKTKLSRPRKSDAEKALGQLDRRLTTPAPFGRCPWRDCQSALRVVPPRHDGEWPWICCPRWKTKKCPGTVRRARDDEVDLLPKALVRRIRLGD